MFRMTACRSRGCHDRLLVAKQSLLVGLDAIPVLGKLSTRSDDLSLGLPERIESKISPEPNSGCWLWTAGTDARGYARIQTGNKPKRAHRVVYEMLVGPIPSGLVLDHLCRVHGCVNPEHLEPVTQKTNIFRGEGIAAKHILKTHCDFGHEFTPENTYQHAKGWRYCKACRKETDHKRRTEPGRAAYMRAWRAAR